MLRLLGGIDFSPLGSEGATRLGRKPATLLALVAAHGTRGVTRERLVALLWGDQDPRSGGAALRQCLHNLRATLGDAATAIDAQRDRIALQHRHADVLEFDELAARGDGASLARAAQLYRGEFVQDVDATDDEAARLIDAERMRLRNLAHGVVSRLAALDGDAASIDAGIVLARRLIGTDPVHEGCWRALMVMLERQGMRAEALHAYERCVGALRDELGVAPSAETAALAKRLRAARPPGAPTAGTPIDASAALFPEDAAPEAVDHLMRAWQLLVQWTAQTHQLARVEAEAAAAIDPQYVQALVVIGWSHLHDWLSGWSPDPEESYRHAGVQVRRALAVGKALPGPYLVQAKLHLWRQRHDEALENVRAALAIAPTNAYTHAHLADVLVHSGWHDEALRHIERGIEIDQNEYGLMRGIEAAALYFTGDLRAAKASAISVIRRNPNVVTGPWMLAVIESDLGNYEAARIAALRARELWPRLNGAAPRLAPPFRLQADRERLAAAWTRIGEPSPFAAGAEVVAMRAAQRSAAKQRRS